METKESKIISTDYSFYHPLVDKDPIGAIEKNKDIRINLSFPENFNVWDVELIIENDDKVEVNRFSLIEDEKNKYHLTFKMDDIGLYWYYFSFSDCYGRHNIVSDYDLGGLLTNDHYNLYQLLIHDPFSKDANWFDDAIMYQIMPDRFFRAGNEQKKDYAIMHNDWYEDPFYKPVGKDWNIDFFGGDLKGIVAKLDYLVNLGINVIYLNPIFLARSTHKYDVGNYLEIDPMFGTEEDFILLCSEANKKGIKIILDMVFNHTGDDSLYFNRYGNYESIGAYQSEKSPYRDLYTFGKYFKHGYRAWWDIASLPALNQDSNYYLDLISSVLKKWLTLGASGIRLDVVDELNNRAVEAINKVCKELNKDIIIIGEVWEDASNKIAYGVRKHYFNGHQLDSVMNYVFKKAIISYLRDGDYLCLQNAIRSTINNYPKYVLDKLMNILDTHDTMRIVNIFYNYHPKSKADGVSYQEDRLESACATSTKLLAGPARSLFTSGIPSTNYSRMILMHYPEVTYVLLLNYNN